MKTPKPLIPEIRSKLIKYVSREFDIDSISRIIFLGSKSLNEIEPITQNRIKQLEYREGFKVYFQPQLF